MSLVLRHPPRRATPLFSAVDQFPACSPALPVVDAELCAGINRLTEGNPDYWSFAGGLHFDPQRYFQYPAMMVPDVQRVLLGMLLRLQPSLRWILDPFAGSGTILTESVSNGLSIHAQDINPLAILLCQAKAGPFDPGKLSEQVQTLLGVIANDTSSTLECSSSYALGKWFTPAVALGLSKIRRAVRHIPDLWTRRFLWTAVAETVRRTSKSRTSTYKLHTRPSSDFARIPDAITVFQDVLSRNMSQYAAFSAFLAQAGHLAGRTYRFPVRLVLGDSTHGIAGTFDALITSPPYGDNLTTVPYGQSAYLPLNWIDLHDIQADLTDSCLRTTYEIDRRSLGGHLLRGRLADALPELKQKSEALDRCLSLLEIQPRDRPNRVLTFAQDLDRACEAMVPALRPNAHLIITVGNRRVGGHEVPLNRILIDFLATRHVRLLASIQRRIPSKRMATRNDVSVTMRHEYVLVFRKEDRA